MGASPLIKKLMRIHGNFVGSNWSAGKRQPSVPYGRVRAVDEFDLSAKFHDHAYATGMDRKKADYLFYKWNVGKGFKRTAAALAVGIQGSLRSKKNNMYLPSPMRTPKKRILGRKGRPLAVPVKKNTGFYKQGIKAAIKKRATAKKKTVQLRGYVGRKVSRTMKRVRKLTPMQKLGTTAVSEFRSSINSTTTVYFGHCSVARSQAFWTIARAIVKLLALRTGISVENFDAIIPGSGTPGDDWALAYKNGLDPNDSTFVYQYLTPGVYTLENVAIKFKEFMETQASKPNIVYEAASYIPVLGSWSRAQISLLDANIHIDMRSHLKFQNRTVSSSGSKSTDIIDTNPLYGRQYGGYGNGTMINVGNGPTWSGLLGSSNEGLIAADGTAVNTMKEPPPAKQLPQVRTSGSVSVAPGEIRKSSLYCKKSFKVNKLVQALGTQSNVNPSGDAYFFHNLGTFRIFALEKVMYDVGEASIDVSFEIQTTSSAYISNVDRPLTAQIVQNI